MCLYFIPFSIYSYAKTPRAPVEENPRIPRGNQYTLSGARESTSERQGIHGPSASAGDAAAAAAAVAAAAAECSYGKENRAPLLHQARP